MCRFDSDPPQGPLFEAEALRLPLEDREIDLAGLAGMQVECGPVGPQGPGEQVADGIVRGELPVIPAA